MPMNGMGMPMIGQNNNNQALSLWTCNMCSYQNAPSAPICTMCKQGKRVINPMMNNRPPPSPQNGYNANPSPMMNKRQPPKPPQNKQNSYWECQSCTFVNSKMSASCKICSNPQPNFNPNPMPPPPQKQQGLPPPIKQQQNDNNKMDIDDNKEP